MSKYLCVLDGIEIVTDCFMPVIEIPKDNTVIVIGGDTSKLAPRDRFVFSSKIGEVYFYDREASHD